MTSTNKPEHGITLTAERPDTVAAQALIAELEAHLEPLYAQESRHGYSVVKLLKEKVDFFVLRYHTAPAACCGIKCFGREYGEIKRMYVRPQLRGLGLGLFMLEHLLDFARRREITVLRLETGIYQTQAIALYEGFGFRRIPPFGDYKVDPLSIFYEKRVAAG